MRLLIVADEKQIVEDLLDHFESNGFEAEIALNARTATVIIGERSMDVVIVGLKDLMSLDSVVESIEEIRMSSPAIPIVVIGGDKSKRIENRVVKAGCTMLCTGPIDKDEILSSVRDILAKTEI